MTLKAYEKLQRHKKFLALSNVVLLSSCSAGDQSHLEEMIARRIDKEFPSPDEDEKEIIEEIKRANLKFAERTIKQHNDGEIFTQIHHNVREKDVHLFHKFGDKNLDKEELKIMGDTLKRAGVKSVTAYLPYIPYQRQDKKDEGRVSIAAKSFFDELTAVLGHRLKRIVTFDLHARQAQAFFDGPFDELTAAPDFAAFYRDLFRQELESDLSEVIVYTPDAGGAPRARYLADLLSTGYGLFDKRRIGHGKADIKFPSLNVQEKKVILIDDMIDTASSLVGEFENKKIGPVQYLQSLGAGVHICATHALLSKKNDLPAEERLRRAGASVLVTDSLPEKYPGYYKENADWMKVISLDYPLAKAFYCNQVGESISDFIQGREKRLRAQKLDFIMQSSKNGPIDVEEK